MKQAEITDGINDELPQEKIDTAVKENKLLALAEEITARGREDRGPAELPGEAGEEISEEKIDETEKKPSEKNTPPASRKYEVVERDGERYVSMRVMGKDIERKESEVLDELEELIPYDQAMDLAQIRAGLLDKVGKAGERMAAARQLQERVKAQAEKLATYKAELAKSSPPAVDAEKLFRETETMGDEQAIKHIQDTLANAKAVTPDLPESEEIEIPAEEEAPAFDINALDEAGMRRLVQEPISAAAPAEEYGPQLTCWMHLPENEDVVTPTVLPLLEANTNAEETLAKAKGETITVVELLERSARRTRDELGKRTPSSTSQPRAGGQSDDRLAEKEKAAQLSVESSSSRGAPAQADAPAVETSDQYVARLVRRRGGGFRL